MLIISSSAFCLSITDLISFEEDEIWYQSRNTNPDDYIGFSKKGTIEFSFEKESPYYEELIQNFTPGTYKYEIKTQDNLNYLYIKGKKTSKYLMLINNNLLILYGKDKTEPLFEGISPSSLQEAIGKLSNPKPSDKQGFIASSELTENGKTYSANNVSSLDSGMPWVEGVKGPGIGESLKIYIGERSLIFSIGYVDVKNSALYKENSRPKKIKITTPTQELFFDLKDTPNPQEVLINEPNAFKGYEVKITIMEVYSGTKYDDTCINFILGRR